VDRVRDHFADQMDVLVSAGSICNVNLQAYNGLARFEDWAKQQLIASSVMHADETGINMGGKRHWLHNVSTTSLTRLYPHEKCGREAMDSFGVISSFQGVLYHDHWKPYYLYDCLHRLCNAHHLRELERTFEQDQQQRAKAMQTCLLDINVAVNDSGDILNIEDPEHERPPPAPTPNKRGRVKRSKERKPLDLLIK
jgi:transposase